MYSYVVPLYSRQVDSQLGGGEGLVSLAHLLTFLARRRTLSLSGTPSPCLVLGWARVVRGKNKVVQ